MVNLTRVSDAAEPAETQSFGYSAAGRLASANGAYGSQAWSYDGVGNRTAETKNGVATSWLYPANSNRLASVAQGGSTVRSFAYAANGVVSQDVWAETTVL